MNHHSQEMDRNAARPTSADGSWDDVVSLKPFFRFLAAYRRVLGMAVVGAILLCISVLLVLLLVFPAERTASIQVRMLFEGAAEGRYPNLTAFSPAEIIATPVLSEVYRMNELQRFGPYADFRESMTVLQASLEQELLAAAYSARLADTKLTPTDRAKLEDEFRKRLADVKEPVYSLTMRRSSRLKVIPAVLEEKILNDTLAVWAQQAKDLKGAVRFNVPAVSQRLMEPGAVERDFLVAADDLRLQARRAVEVTQGLMNVPGAATFRSAKELVSLSDVDFALKHALRTEIEPLMSMIQQAGLTNDPPATQQYLRSRISQLRLERDATRGRIQAMQDALRGYMTAKGARTNEGVAGEGTAARQQGFDTQTLIPQFSDTFLDRVIEMSTPTQAADVAYRQNLSDRLIAEGEELSGLERDTAYYEQLEDSGRPGAGPLPAAQVVAMKQRLQRAADAVQLSIGRLATVYAELSEQRLNPSASLYAISRPFATKTRYALAWSTVMLSLALAVLLALIVTPIVCAFHRSSIRQAASAQAR